MTEQQSTPTSWADLVTADDTTRVDRMVDAYSKMAELPADARREMLSEQIRFVYALPDEDLRAMTEGRLKAWLAMDPGKAKVVGSEFEAVLDTMPADLAMRRVTVVQSVAFKLTAEEQTRLREMVPAVMGNAPPVLTGGAQPPKEAEPDSRRPWWAFWRSGAR